jgi:hypothetical protein
MLSNSIYIRFNVSTLQRFIASNFLTGFSAARSGIFATTAPVAQPDRATDF